MKISTFLRLPYHHRDHHHGRQRKEREMTDEKELEGKDMERRGKGGTNPTKFQEKRRQGNLGRKTGCSGLLQPLCLKRNQTGIHKDKLQKIKDVLVIN